MKKIILIFTLFFSSYFLANASSNLNFANKSIEKDVSFINQVSDHNIQPQELSNHDFRVDGIYTYYDGCGQKYTINVTCANCTTGAELGELADEWIYNHTDDNGCFF